MLRQRTHNVIETLADQNDVVAAGNRFVQQGNSARFQPRLQRVFEKLFAQQVQAIATHSAQNRMQQPGRKFPIGDVQQRTRYRQQGHRPTPTPALQKTLRIPGEKSYWPDCGQVDQASFHPPKNRLAHGRARRLIFASRILAD